MWSARAVPIALVAVQVAVAGSYSSAVATKVLAVSPPVTSTFPVLNKVPVWK